MDRGRELRMGVGGDSFGTPHHFKLIECMVVRVLSLACRSGCDIYLHIVKKDTKKDEKLDFLFRVSLDGLCMDVFFEIVPI